MRGARSGASGAKTAPRRVDLGVLRPPRFVMNLTRLRISNERRVSINAQTNSHHANAASCFSPEPPTIRRLQNAVSCWKHASVAAPPFAEATPRVDRDAHTLLRGRGPLRRVAQPLADAVHVVRLDPGREGVLRVDVPLRHQRQVHAPREVRVLLGLHDPGQGEEALVAVGPERPVCALLLWTMICQGFRSGALWGAPSTAACGLGDRPTPDLSRRKSRSRSTYEKSK